MRMQKWMLVSVFALFGASAAHSADPVKIRLSWVAPVTNWGSIMLEKKELAQHLGKSYTLEPVRYPGTPPMVTALVAACVPVPVKRATTILPISLGVSTMW